MVATRRRRDDDRADVPTHVEPADSGSDDDDAPEEVTLHTGKEAALSQRKRERDAEKQSSASGKDRRKWQRTREAQPASDGEAKSEEDDDEEEEEAEGAVAAAQDSENMDLLPESVIQAMAEAEAEASDRRLMERRVVTSELRAALQRGPKARQRRTFKERDVGPVTVKVLKSVGHPTPSKAAKAFLQERLHSGVQRSNGMLQPTKIGGTFVYGPKV